MNPGDTKDLPSTRQIIDWVKRHTYLVGDLEKRVEALEAQVAEVRQWLGGRAAEKPEELPEQP